jgi:hypothetical protein
LPDVALKLQNGRQLGQFIQLTYSMGNAKG